MNSGFVRVYVEVVEICGPGLPNWEASRSILAGQTVYRPAPIILEPPPQLSAAERRRAIPSVKLALNVATMAVARSGYDPKILPGIFASSGADGETIGAILSALAEPNREVSPTRFHNSVHNAPSGYWGIAMQSQEAVTSLSCYDTSFAAGLLEAAVQTMTMNRPTLLVAYDLPYLKPLDDARHIGAAFGVSIVLSSKPSGVPIAEIHLRLASKSDGDASMCADPDLEALRCSNPAARSLPLLVMLASGSSGRLQYELSHVALAIDVLKC